VNGAGVEEALASEGDAAAVVAGGALDDAELVKVGPAAEDDATAVEVSAVLVDAGVDEAGADDAGADEAGADEAAPLTGGREMLTPAELQVSMTAF